MPIVFANTQIIFKIDRIVAGNQNDVPTVSNAVCAARPNMTSKSYDKTMARITTYLESSELCYNILAELQEIVNDDASDCACNPIRGAGIQ